MASLLASWVCMLCAVARTFTWDGLTAPFHTRILPGMSDEATEGTSGGDHRGREQMNWGNFWRRPEIVIPTAITLLTALLGLYLARPPADVVADCKDRNPGATGKLVPAGEQKYVIEGCRQPGLPGVDKNGLWRVELERFNIPNTSMASEFTDAEVFATDCPALGFDYLYSNQGLAVHTRFTVQNTQTVSGYDGHPVNINEAHGIPAVVSASSGERLIVVVNARNQLQSATCEPLSAVTTFSPSAGT